VSAHAIGCLLRGDRLRTDDELIASGPGEGERTLAELCGWVLVDDNETGEDTLVPVGDAHRP